MNVPRRNGRSISVLPWMNNARNSRRGDFLIRNLIGADQQTGAIVIGDVVQEGQTVQFQVRDAQSADQDLQLCSHRPGSPNHQPRLGALLFSCCGRGKGLFGVPNHDAAAVQQQLGDIPVAGFFAQGEVGPVEDGIFFMAILPALRFSQNRTDEAPPSPRVNPIG